jgi:hypothetical protein
MKRFLNMFILVAFCFSSLNSYPVFAAQVNLPQPGTLLPQSAQFAPVTLRGLKFDRQNPFKLSFILDEGNTKLTDAQLKETSRTLIRYFLAALTTPGQDMWVNLSPYEQNRILPESFAATDLGNDMLVQDYLLKQLASSLTYPESELGKKYWDTVNNFTTPKGGRSATASPAAQRALPQLSLTKVWITPNETQVYETGDKVFITKSSVKILSDQDYLAMRNNNVGARLPRPGQGNPAPTTNNVDAFKTLIVPAIEKEVNVGKNFAGFRQLHSAVILAAWFKNRLKDSIYQQLYIDKNKTAGINANDPQAKEKIFAQYVEAFKKGAYNYVKKEAITPYGGNSTTGLPAARLALARPSLIKITKRAYFSGGASEAELMNPANTVVVEPGMKVGGFIAGGKLVVNVVGDPVKIDPSTAKSFEGLTIANVTIKIGADGSQLVTPEENAQAHKELRIKMILGWIADDVRSKNPRKDNKDVLPRFLGEEDFRSFLLQYGIKRIVPGTSDKMEYSYSGYVDNTLARAEALGVRDVERRNAFFTIRLTHDGILAVESPLFGGGHAGLNRLAVYGRNSAEIQHELYELRNLQVFAQELHKQGLVHYEPGVPLGDCLRNFLKGLIGKKQVDGGVITKLDNAISAAGVNVVVVSGMAERFKSVGGVSHGEELSGEAQIYKIDLFLQAIHANAQKFFPVNDEPADNVKTIFLSSGIPSAPEVVRVEPGLSVAETKAKQEWNAIKDKFIGLLPDHGALARELSALLNGGEGLAYDNPGDYALRYFAEILLNLGKEKGRPDDANDLRRPFYYSDAIKSALKGLDTQRLSYMMDWAFDKAVSYTRLCAALKTFSRVPKEQEAEAVWEVHLYNPRNEGLTVSPNENGNFGSDSGYSRETIMEKIELLACGRVLKAEERKPYVNSNGDFTDKAGYVAFLEKEGATALTIVFPYLVAENIVRKGAAGKAQNKNLPDLIADARTALGNDAIFDSEAVAHVKEALLQEATFDALAEKIYQLLSSGKADLEKDSFVAKAIVEALALAAKRTKVELSLPKGLSRLVEAARSIPSIDEVSPDIDVADVIKVLRPSEIKGRAAFAVFCAKIAAMAQDDKDDAGALSLKRAAVEAIQQAGAALKPDKNDFTISGEGSKNTNRGQHEKINERIKRIVYEIATELKLRNVNAGILDGEYDLYAYVMQHGVTRGKERYVTTSRGELRITEDGILVIVDNRLTPEDDHAGRDRLCVYVHSKRKIPHELYELRAWMGVAQKMKDAGLIPGYDGQLLGTYLRGWLNQDRRKGNQWKLDEENTALYKILVKMDAAMNVKEQFIPRQIEDMAPNGNFPLVFIQKLEEEFHKEACKAEPPELHGNSASELDFIIAGDGPAGPGESAGPKKLGDPAVGGITETGLTVETKGDGTRVPLFKNVPLRAENFPGFDFTIDGLKRNQTVAQVVF